MKPRERRPSLPHPDDIAARKALANASPVSLESVRRQAKASEEWRLRHSVNREP